jgi:hypothetical protein
MTEIALAPGIVFQLAPASFNGSDAKIAPLNASSNGKSGSLEAQGD